MTRYKRGVVATASAALVLALWLPAGVQAGSKAARPPRPGPLMRGVASQRVETPDGRATAGSCRSTIECVISTEEEENVKLECPGDLFPTRETTIAVDPTDDKHMVAAAIDGDFGDQDIEFSTTFDGGKTW